MEKFIAVDAGLYSAGWAIFEEGLPIDAGLVKPGAGMRDENLVVRANSIGEQLASIAEENACRSGIIEMPVYYGQGDKHAASIFKLCVCIGAISSALNVRRCKVETVNVPVWKGQLPKEVVIARIKTILPLTWKRLNLEKDMWDAVGIGLWKVGRF